MGLRWLVFVTLALAWASTGSATGKAGSAWTIRRFSLSELDPTSIKQKQEQFKDKPYMG
jgi:hypothetical protein